MEMLRDGVVRGASPGSPRLAFPIDDRDFFLLFGTFGHSEWIPIDEAESRAIMKFRTN